MRVAWLCTYPVNTLQPQVVLARQSNNYHPSSWIVNLCQCLGDVDGIDLHVITLCPYVAGSQVLKHGNVTFHVIKSGVPVLHKGYPYYFPVDVLSGFRLEVARMHRVLKKLSPDIVHAFGTEDAFALAAVGAGYPSVISMQGIVGELAKVEPSFRFRRVRGYEEAVIRDGRHFFCRTCFDSGYVRRLNASARIHTVQEAINPVFFERDWCVSDMNRNVLYVGALVKRKGIEDLLEGVSMAQASIPDIHLHVVGSGVPDYVNSLQAIIAERSLSGHVTFHGTKNSSEIAGLHHECQLFVSPSWLDNSPNGVAEAMVSGMPVLATDVGGIPSMITDNETGRLVGAASPVKLAEQIVDLLQNPEERERLGRNARNQARSRHCLDAVVDTTIEAYHHILYDGKGG